MLTRSKKSTQKQIKYNENNLRNFTSHVIRKLRIEN